MNNLNGAINKLSVSMPETKLIVDNGAFIQLQGYPETGMHIMSGYLGQQSNPAFLSQKMEAELLEYLLKRQKANKKGKKK